MKVKKAYIAFVNNRNFLSVRIKRSRLELNLALKKGELNDQKQVAVDISDKRHDYSTTQYAMNVDDKSDLGHILSLIVQAYDKTNPRSHDSFGYFFPARTDRQA